MMPMLSKEVMFIMSLPRLAFTDNMRCSNRATYTLGLHGEYYEGVFWEQGIEKCLESAIRHGYKYGLTIDYDTYYTPYHIVDLYNLMQKHPDVDILVPLQSRRDMPYPLCGTYKTHNGDLVNIVGSPFDDGIAPLETGHFGLTLIKLSALKKLPSPWFISKPDENGGWGQGKKDADVNFWLKCRDAGLKVRLAEVWIGHLELKCSWCGPSHEDHFKTRTMDIQEVHKGHMPTWAQPKSFPTDERSFDYGKSA